MLWNYQRHVRSVLLILMLGLFVAASLMLPKQASAAPIQIGKDAFYGKVPGLNEKSRVTIWYGTNTATQSQLDTLKTYNLVILEPTIRIINVDKGQYYLETFTANQVNEIKRGTDGILGTADDVIVLAYISVGELLTSSVFTGFTGSMTIQNGKDVGLLPANYSGPSGPLHGPNPWNYNAQGQYINVENGAIPDGTYNAGYNNYANMSIASDYSSTGSLLQWRNSGLMPWYLDQQGATANWITDSRYIYGGYWKNGDSSPDTNLTYGGGYINGGDPSWKKLITFMTDKLEHDVAYDGVFLDTVDTPDPVGGAGPTTSWGPRGNFGFTAQGMVELVEAVKAVDPSKVVAANRAYWYFNPDEGTSQFAVRYRKAINILLTESWYYNPYITSGSKFYDENTAFAANWNTNPASSTYRNRDNFGGFWQDYINAQANQDDGFNVIICDFTIPSASTDKWMHQVVDVSHYMGYDVSGATNFTNFYGNAKAWLDAKGSTYAAPSLAGVHATDLYSGFENDGLFTDWTNETPIFNDPSGSNAKGITKIYTKFINDKFFMKIDANTTLNLVGEMIYFDNDKKGTTGWQGVSWPITPDARIYFENANKAYLAPHIEGQGDVFKFPVTTISNNGWPVRFKQSGTQAELEFNASDVFPSSLAGKPIWTWFRTANFGGSLIAFTIPAAPAIPSAPTGLAAVAGDSQVTLSWAANSETNLTGYNVYQNGVKLNTTPVSGLTYLRTGLSNGTTYNFQVSAVNTLGNESALSSTITSSPHAPTAPNAPTGVTATAGNNQVTLAWSSNTEPNLSGYNVYRNNVKLNSTPLTSPSYVDTGLTNGTTYAYQISAVNTSSLESSKSTAVNATPSATVSIVIDGNASDWGNVPLLASGSSTVQVLQATSAGGNLKLLLQGTGMNVKGQFFIDTDNNPLTGYNAAGWTNTGSKSGAEYMIENNIVYKNLGGGWSWSNVKNLATTGTSLEFERNATTVELTVPYATLGVTQGAVIRIGYIKNDSLTDRLPAQNTVLPSITLGP
ncbi:hypothetical protein A8709_15700 [Paenibacillus pectinilyticus]|uniref:Fibronectin type-III domain-containing protein n=1 Tax=Paenibacillus pectinilyticus TaxID=512399 RepID=A0A1C1A4P9_9BACL|nr:fibronectin type III domain-containing protein [Paenibacillus pectinilyticus]OCT15518.1 hypothetical protein A8709_15700 [Paenibacillus pectinilyticus]